MQQCQPGRGGIREHRGNITGVAQAAQQVTSGATETQQTAVELARTAADLCTTVATYHI